MSLEPDDTAVVRVVTGTGTGPTGIAAYDAALAAANVHNYNLVTVSSVIPANAQVERVDRAPDLGPAGNRLMVVQSRADLAGVGQACAGLGWTTGPGPGLFYEAHGPAPDAVEKRLRAGLDAGRDLREWTFTDEETALSTVETSEPTGDVDDKTNDETNDETDGETREASNQYACAVALAVYGDSDPIC